MTCMTPRALAGEIIALLKPLSCHAMAAASDDGAPDCAARVPTCPALSRPGEAIGAACGTIVRAGAGAVALIVAPGGELDDGAGDELGGGVQAVHVRHLSRGHARRGGQAAERVAGAHLVGAHRLGGALRGGGRGLGDRRAARSRQPQRGARMTHESSFSPLAAASELSDTPWRAAMALSVSPGCTR